MKLGVPKEVLFRDLEGESVLLHLGSGQYFGLDEVGTFVWNRLAEGLDVPEVEEKVLAEYDAEPAQVRADVNRIVGELCDHGLLEIRGDASRVAG